MKTFKVKDMDNLSKEEFDITQKIFDRISKMKYKEDYALVITSNHEMGYHHTCKGLKVSIGGNGWYTVNGPKPNAPRKVFRIIEEGDRKDERIFGVFFTFYHTKTIQIQTSLFNYLKSQKS